MRNYCVTAYRKPLKKKTPGIITAIILFLIVVVSGYVVVHQACKYWDYDYSAKAKIEKGGLCKG